MWQLRSETVVILIKILGEEEMAVGIVVVGLYAELCRLHTALGRNCFRLGILLRDKSGQREFAELQFRFHTEKGRSSLYQARTGGHADVTGVDAFDDFVFLSFVR